MLICGVSCILVTSIPSLSLDHSGLKIKYPCKTNKQKRRCNISDDELVFYAL
jgi:hypothetical protein